MGSTEDDHDIDGTIESDDMSHPTSTEAEDRGTTVAGKMSEAASFQTEGGSDGAQRQIQTRQ